MTTTLAEPTHVSEADLLELSLYPFRTSDGKPSPFLLSPGDVAVETLEVASVTTRERLVRCLRVRFPHLDWFALEARLKQPSAVLVSGISEESAARLMAFFKDLGIAAQLARTHKTSVFQRLWNPGLIAVAGASALSLFFDGITVALLMLIGLGLWAVGVYRLGRREIPIIRSSYSGTEAEYWLKSATLYSHAIRAANLEDRNRLEHVTTRVFETLTRLKSLSVYSAAAGGVEGELADKLKEALRVAIDILRQINQSSGENQVQLRSDLASIADLLDELSDEHGDSPHPRAEDADRVSREIHYLADQVAGIVKEAQLKPTGKYRTEPRTW